MWGRVAYKRVKITRLTKSNFKDKLARYLNVYFDNQLICPVAQRRGLLRDPDACPLQKAAAQLGPVWDGRLLRAM